MRILHVLLSPRAEGTPRLVLDWLTVKDYEQDLLFLSKEGELKDEFLQTGNWQHYNTAFVARFKSLFLIRNLVTKTCEERKPDMVIAWMMGFSPWVLWGAKQAGVQRLIVHGGNPPGDSFIGKYLFSYMSFWIGNLVGSKVICCSDYIRDAFRAIPFLSKKQFISVYNCFQPSKFQLAHPPQRNANQALMVATMEPHKDHTTLLHAWKIIEQKGYAYTLQLAGNGGLFDKLQLFATTLNLKNIQFLGSRKDVPVLLHSSSLFVFSTTHQEGFGTVLIEALASGCTIIASDVPACREVLKGGAYGKLVPAGDATALADAIILAFEQPLDKQARLKNMQYANEFTPEKMIQRYLEIV